MIRKLDAAAAQPAVAVVVGEVEMIHTLGAIKVAAIVVVAVVAGGIVEVGVEAQTGAGVALVPDDREIDREIDRDREIDQDRDIDRDREIDRDRGIDQDDYYAS